MGDDGDDKITVSRKYMASNKKLPTKEQLQAFAKRNNVKLPFSQVAVVVKTFRAGVLNAFVNCPVTLSDEKYVDFEGVLTAWTEKNERFTFEMRAGQVKYVFESDKQPMIEVSAEAAEWLE